MYAVDSPIDEIQTERLYLRPGRRTDLPELHAAITETLDALVRWLPWAREGHTRMDTRRYLRGARSAWARRLALEFVIEEASSGEVVGITSLHRIDWARRCAGLGYWLRRSRWGSGYATEAAAATIDHGFARMGLHRIEIHIALGNDPSHAVARRLGARREGIARHAERLNGAFVDHVQYSLLQPEWEARE